MAQRTEVRPKWFKTMNAGLRKTFSEFKRALTYVCPNIKNHSYLGMVFQVVFEHFAF
jgi:hypothetical protein